MIELLPREIVSELNRHIIGQDNAKRAVAIALRNRWRRQKLDGRLREEVLPKNILMIGQTGVGKTEIARRLAKLANAPFLKVEATKFTEIGYVGRDVEHIIRDLLEIAIGIVRKQKHQQVKIAAQHAAEERVITALVGTDAKDETREYFRKKFKNGELEKTEIEIETADSAFSGFEIPGMPSGQIGMINLSSMLDKSIFSRTKSKRMSVKDGYETLVTQESDKLVDQEQVAQEAIVLTENEGIVFLDEIDKICHQKDQNSGNVSREGVQRDLLPLIEGTIVPTKYGPVKSNHVLFIAAGAFHIAKPSDLLPELQGRMPIRIELDTLSKEDFVRVLTEPEASLTKQYVALLATEGVTLEFTNEAVNEIARIAAEVNEKVENIGARRLQTIMEHVLDDISFTAPERNGEKYVVDGEDIRNRMSKFIKNDDLSRFIL